MTNLSLEKLIKQKQQLESKIKLMESRQSDRLRKEDTRRKILAGAFVLNKYTEAGSMGELTHELDQFLFKPADRALFGLQPRSE